MIPIKITENIKESADSKQINYFLLNPRQRTSRKTIPTKNTETIKKLISVNSLTNASFAGKGRQVGPTLIAQLPSL